MAVVSVRRLNRSAARTWLAVLGGLLLLLGVLGAFRPVVDAFHGLGIHLEGGENVLHWLLGLGLLAVAFAVRNDRLVGTLAVWTGIAFLALGLLGFFVPALGALWHVEAGDNVTHLLLGGATVWAGLASRPRGEAVGRRRAAT